MDLARDLDRQVARIERRDRSDSRFTGHEIVPKYVGSDADRRDGTDAGDKRFCHRNTPVLINLAEDDRRVVSAKADRRRHGDVDLLLAGFVRNVVKVALRVRS